MRDEYWVLHSGVGSDGGFGDYAPPTWSEDPVTVKGQVIWFGSAAEAKSVAGTLNDLSTNAFYETGTHCAYDGCFPVEYEVRKIVVPNNQRSTHRVLNELADEYSQEWAYLADADDEEEDEW